MGNVYMMICGNNIVLCMIIPLVDSWLVQNCTGHSKGEVECDSVVEDVASYVILLL